MSRTRDLLRLAAADRRRIGLYLLGGWAMFALIFIIAMNDLGCASCPEETVDRFLGMKVLHFCLLYAMAPWVIFILGVHQNTGVMVNLPLSRRQINQSLLLSGGILFLCCLPAWAFLVWQLPINGIPIHPWMFVFSAFGLLLYQLYGMLVNVFWRAAVPGIFPFLIFPPHSHETFKEVFETMTTPWPSVILLVLVLLAIPRVLARPLPRNVRCS
ncbi:MAG: hypothetical protein ABFS42_10010 [Candidatus Krumholzibacteriota bacterium]